MRHDYRFFAPVLIAWAVAAFLIQTPELGFFAAGLCIVSAILGVAFLVARKTVFRRTLPSLVSLTVLTLTLVGAVSLRIGFEHTLRAPTELVHALEQSSVGEAQNITWEATATSAARPSRTMFSTGSAQNLQLEAVVTAFYIGGEKHGASIPVRISADAASIRTVVIGSRLQFSADATPLPVGGNQAYRLSTTDATVIESPWFLSATHALRERLREEASRLTGWGSELIPGLAVGDTTLVSAELDAAMKTSSLSHLTAVSGANCAIITGLILAAGKVLRWRRWLRVAVATLFLGGFVALVTPEPSVLRAAVMSVAAMIAMLSSRKGAGVPVLGLAALTLLLLDPWQARHLGFVLSVLATAGIVLFTEPIARVLRRLLPPWLALVFAVPIAAQLTCQPAIILLEPSLPTFGVIANVLAAPAAPLATVIGLAATLLVWIAPPIGEFATWLTWFPASYIAEIARTVAGIPIAKLPWLEGWTGALLLASLTATVIIAFFRPSSGQATTPSNGAPRSWRWVAASLAISTMLAISVVRPVTTWLLMPRDWRVFACDVGQGDAVLIRGSEGVMLVDTGIDAKLIRECLNFAGIGEVDLLVVTHDDRDHAGGMSGIVDQVRTALISPSVSDEPRTVLTPLASFHVPTHSANRGMQGSLGDVSWQVLWPLASHAPRTTNDASVVLRVNTPEFSMLLLGDLGEEAQQQLLRVSVLAPVDVVKVSHHGSADQSAELYSQISASLGIISVGENNGYGHPTRSLLDTLARAETNVLRTDMQGSLAIARDPDGRWRIWGSSAVG